MRAACIILFDLDGTLIDCGGAGRRALDATFGRRLGARGAFERIRFGGMTDHAIVREALAAIGRPYERSLAEDLLEDYALELERELDERPLSVLPHAEAAVRRARASGHAVGVGTGNVRRGAMVKLSRAGLDGAFGFGGYGCDAEERAEVLRAGVLRAHAAGAATDAEVLVVGDTPKDVAAAHAIGARCLAVATGSFDGEALRAAGADLLAVDLADPVSSRALGDGR